MSFVGQKVSRRSSRVSAGAFPDPHSFFSDKAGNVIIIHDASGVPEEITSEE